MKLKIMRRKDADHEACGSQSAKRAIDDFVGGDLGRPFDVFMDDVQYPLPRPSRKNAAVDGDAEESELLEGLYCSIRIFRRMTTNRSWMGEALDESSETMG